MVGGPWSQEQLVILDHPWGEAGLMCPCLNQACSVSLNILFQGWKIDSAHISVAGAVNGLF